MATLKEEAEAWRLAVLVGLYAVADVEAWALRHVETEASPDPALVGIFHSCGRHPEDVAAVLAAVAGPDSGAAAVRHVHSEMSHRLDDRPDDARLILQMLKSLVHVGSVDEYDTSEIDRLDDVFSLAATGTYGTVAEAQEELALFLRRDGESRESVLARSN